MNNFFSGLVHPAFCVFFMSVLVCFSLTWGAFLPWSSWRAGLCHWSGVPLLPLCPSFIDLLFHSTSRFRRVLFVCLFTLIFFHWLAQWLYFIFESWCSTLYLIHSTGRLSLSFLNQVFEFFISNFISTYVFFSISLSLFNSIFRSCIFFVIPSCHSFVLS